MIHGYYGNIEELTKSNTDFRRVLYTARHVQLVVMHLNVGEEIGQEIHDVDQFFRFESGTGKAIVNETTYNLKDGDVVIVPAGAEHNVINTSDTEPLKLYTMYCPPHHADGTVHAAKADAEGDEEHFDGTTTE